MVSGRDYEFANDLIQEIVYADTPEPTRLAYHRRAADLLTGQPESLARHAAAAGDWPRAARAWLLAAEEAMHRYAATDAAALATRGFDAAERAGDGEVRARALVLRGRAHEAAGAHDAALADLTQGAAGARAAGDRRLEMLALRELGGDVPASRGLPITDYTSNLESGLRDRRVARRPGQPGRPAVPARDHRGEPASARSWRSTTACGPRPPGGPPRTSRPWRWAWTGSRPRTSTSAMPRA